MERRADAEPFLISDLVFAEGLPSLKIQQLEENLSSISTPPHAASPSTRFRIAAATHSGERAPLRPSGVFVKSVSKRAGRTMSELTVRYSALAARNIASAAHFAIT